MGGVVAATLLLHSVQQCTHVHAYYICIHRRVCLYLSFADAPGASNLASVIADNPAIKQQYTSFLNHLLYKPQLSVEDGLAAVTYLLLQDRLEDAETLMSR